MNSNATCARCGRSQWTPNRRPTGGWLFRAKRVPQRVAESVPVRHGKPKMFGHRPALDDFGGIVMLESQRVLGGTAFVGDFIDFWKGGFHKKSKNILTEPGRGYCWVAKWQEYLLCLVPSLRSDSRPRPHGRVLILESPTTRSVLQQILPQR